jgi:hypothetical protein
MRRVSWIGRIGAAALLTIVVVALAFELIRGLAFPNPRDAFNHWYGIAGWIVGIQQCRGFR